MRLAFAFFLLAGLAGAEEASARLEWRTGTIGDSSPRRIPLVTQAPQDVTLPEKLEQEVFAQVALGDQATLTLILGPDRVWVDRDMDGDLREEHPLEWFGPVGRRWRNVYLEVPFAGAKQPASIQVLLVYQPEAKPPRIDCTARAYRRGTVVLAGRQRLVVLADSDGDLRFDKPDEDLLFLDIDGNGKIKLGDRSHEELRAGIPFRLNDRGYVATVPETGGAMVVFRQIEEVPPPARRRWPVLARPRAGNRARGGGNLEALANRYEAEVERHRVAWLRRPTVARIGAVGTPEAFSLLWRIYRRDEQMRIAAVGAMGYVQYAAQADKVAKIASSAKQGELQVAAMAALHGMAAAGRDRVYARLLRSRNESVSAAAAQYLAYTGTETARKALIEAVERLARVKHRYYAYRAATRYFRAAPALELMRVAARSADARLAALGLSDLHYLQRPEARSLALLAAKRKVRDNSLAMALTEILASRGDADAVAAVLPLAEHESLTLHGRLLDLLKLVRDPGGLGALAKALGARVPAIRLLATRVLAGVPGAQTTAALAAQLDRERDAKVAPVLIKALARHGGALGAAAIVRAARRFGKDDALRRTILRMLADIGLAYEPVRLYFEAKMQSPSWEERVLAISAAGRARARTLVQALIENLDHRQWQVRLAAIQALRQIRVKEAITPLIGRLADEKEKRIRRAIGETLFRITGKNLFADYDLWVRWWRGARDTFEVPARIDAKKPRRGTRTVARFYGLPVESERVVFVIDRSGSMSSRTGNHTDYENAAAEVMRVVNRLDSKAKINVILFESEVTAWKKKLISVHSASRAALKRYLDAHGPTGGTNLYDGLEMALNHRGADTIFLLSDGEPGSGKYVNDNDIVREVRRINELKRITIHCVSLGRDSTLLRRLADENGGRYTRR